MDTFDFAFGHDDVYTTAELPDNAAAAALALTLNADGRTRGKDSRAADTEEVDAAAGRTVSYAAPGTT